MSFLFYKRPPKVSKQGGHLSDCQGDGGKDCTYASIPPELSFENVICNKCMPPCSLQDFLHYLLYVSRDAENLQFYLWMIDYFQRFRRIPKAERALSPRWTGHAPPIREQNGYRMIGTRDIEMYSEELSDCSTWGGEQSEFTDEYSQTLDQIKFGLSPVKTQPHFDHLVWHPAEAQPLRSEITRITNHYLTPGGPRQLNLSHNDRATVLRALEYTTHPSALRLVKKMLNSTLRNQSHPNFIRWTICNSNKRWTYAVRLFALLSISIGFLVAIVLILSRASRYWRIFAAPEWWFGITNLIAASRGLCVLLHRLHSRQNHAWEIKAYQVDDVEAVLKDEFGHISHESTRSQWPVNMEVFGPANNYNGESWVSIYARKPWYRKLFEKRIKIYETGLIAIQNRMIWQAEAWALIITIPLTIIFVTIPNAKLF